MRKRPKVVVVSGRLTPEAAVEKCSELIEYAEKIGGIDEPTVRKLEEARDAAKAGRMTRIQAHLLTTVEKAIKTSMRWKFSKLRELIGEEARSPQVHGDGVRIDGVEWKNPVKFEREFKFRCPRAVGGESTLTLEGCEKHDCTCMGMLKAQLYLAQIEEKIEEERDADRREGMDEPT